MSNEETTVQSTNENKITLSLSHPERNLHQQARNESDISRNKIAQQTLCKILENLNRLIGYIFLLVCFFGLSVFLPLFIIFKHLKVWSSFVHFYNGLWLSYMLYWVLRRRKPAFDEIEICSTTQSVILRHRSGKNNNFRLPFSEVISFRAVETYQQTNNGIKYHYLLFVHTTGGPLRIGYDEPHTNTARLLNEFLDRTRDPTRNDTILLNNHEDNVHLSSNQICNTLPKLSTMLSFNSLNNNTEFVLMRTRSVSFSVSILFSLAFILWIVFGVAYTFSNLGQPSSVTSHYYQVFIFGITTHFMLLAIVLYYSSIPSRLIFQQAEKQRPFLRLLTLSLIRTVFHVPVLKYSKVVAIKRKRKFCFENSAEKYIDYDIELVSGENKRYKIGRGYHEGEVLHLNLWLTRCFPHLFENGSSTEV